MILIRAIELGPWLPFALVGIVFMISLPSMFMAALRLRHRTLGPILDATGWAVNAQIKINMPLARFLTQTRSIPFGSTRNRIESFAGKQNRWAWFIGIVILLLAIGAAYFTYSQGLWDWSSLRLNKVEPEPLPQVTPTA